MVGVWNKLVYTLFKLKRRRYSQMLFGTYSHQLDQKNRFRIPTKFKAVLGENLVLTKGSGKCLYLFSATEMQNQIINKTATISLFDESAQKSLRLLLSSTFELEIDNQGRALLPQALRAYAGIDKNLVSIGVGNRVEIWAEGEWLKYSEGADITKELSRLKDYGV